MKLLIKFPTRNRKNKFLLILKKYYSFLSKKNNVHFLITMDEDDSEMNNDDIREILNSYENLTYYYGDSKTKIDAINKDLEKITDWDIVLLASDDMIPIVKGYDEIIINKMKNHYLDTDGVLWFNDGYQGDKLNTLSILGKKYYDRFGYIYNPEYKSVWCDNEFMSVANILGKQTYISNVIIKHEHPDWGFGGRDEIHTTNIKNESSDRQIFNKRKLTNFGIDEKINSISNIKLSILICSLDKRKNFLNRLLNILDEQKNDSVEIIVNCDSGEKTIGEKRNELLTKSKGEYICFIDDDDTVIDTYIYDILDEIKKSNPDVIGFELNYYVNNVLDGIAYHSLNYKEWSQTFDAKTKMNKYFRNPNHLNPVKREIALKVMFPYLNMKEDYDYSMRLLPLLKTQEYINKSIYNYLFIPNK